FQAEDGIRDRNVTGVQTCALPICIRSTVMRLFSSQTITPAVLAALAVTSGYSVPAAAQEAKASGEVRRVDADAGKITLQHGAIRDLDLEAMTLVYKIDPALLSGI